MTNYIVENKEMIPFNDMSDEDKLKIVNALSDDNYIVDTYIAYNEQWCRIPVHIIGPGGRYRVHSISKSLNIP